MNYSKPFDWFFAFFCLAVAFGATPKALDHLHRTLKLSANSSSVFVTTP